MVKDRRGSALITVVITITVLSILGAAVIFIANSRLSMTVSYEGLIGARYAAEAGIEEMKREILEGVKQKKVQIEDAIKLYIESEDYDESQAANKAGEIANNILNSYCVNLKNTNNYSRNIEQHAGYTIEDISYNTDGAKPVITVASRGCYGKGMHREEKIITAGIQLDSASTTFTTPGGQIDLPVIVTASTKINPNAKNFKVEGDFYLPEGTSLGVENSRYEFSKKFTSNGSINIGGGGSVFKVENDTSINGDFEINSEKSVVVVDKGDMKVTGNLTISGTRGSEKYDFYVNGDLYVGDNLTLNSEKVIYVEGNIYCKGNITIRGNQGQIFANGISCVGGVTANVEGAKIQINSKKTDKIIGFHCNKGVTLGKSIISVVWGNFICEKDLKLTGNNAKLEIVQNGSVYCNSVVYESCNGTSITTNSGHILVNGNVNFNNMIASIDVGNGLIYFKGTASQNSSLTIPTDKFKQNIGDTQFNIIKEQCLGQLDEVVIEDIEVETYEPVRFNEENYSRITDLENTIYYKETNNGIIIQEDKGTVTNPVLIVSENNLTIQSDSNSTLDVIDVYGIVYCKKDVTLKGKVNIYGCIICEGSLSIDTGSNNSEPVVYHDSKIISSVLKADDSIASYFNTVSSSGTIILNSINGSVAVSSWSE